MTLCEAFRHFVKTLRKDAELRSELRDRLIDSLTKFREEFPTITIAWKNDSGQIRVQVGDHSAMLVGFREDGMYFYHLLDQPFTLVHNHASNSNCFLNVVISTLAEWLASYALHNNNIDIHLGQENGV